MSDLREDTYLEEDDSIYEESDQTLDITKEPEEDNRADGFKNIFKDPRRIALFIVTIVVSLTLIILGSISATNRYSSSSSSSGSSYNSSSSSSSSYYSSDYFSTSGTVYNGSNQSVYATSSYKYYKFVPSYSGTYYFYTTGSIDTYGALYGSSGSSLSSDDDGGSGNNFRISYYCYSGSTYYIAVKAYSSSGYVTLYVSTY